ncbi:glycosyltransferase 87 family protein [Actinokineospora bangkokensis]|uniref:DUF2029 domain-containing protein n=1 Tax=Actinokineospora bangkokensis TaxID=1193682 RepID=A0A1Q9LPL3_9PSEU|nr:glycosyltransferase 87 family protein [Actinokineospora bangkokensis]OLR93968.1 hypothetical protein BJP25_13325 [Actinokineospora bangkokensis]
MPLRAALRRDHAVVLDVVLYAVSGAFAVGTAFGSEFYGYRVWGNCASVGYLAAALLSAWLLLTGDRRRARVRWTAAAVGWGAATLLPLGLLVAVRDPGFRWGPWPWSFPSQPEVWVIERAARALLADGTPYLPLAALGPTPNPDDYTPYGPAMTLFGMPRALFGDHAVTDARIAFLVVFLGALALSWHLLGRPPVPVRAAQLLVVGPLTALTLAVAGDDVAVLGLVVLAAVVAHRPGVRSAPLWAGLLCAVLITMKLTAVPAAVVLAVGLAAERGRRGAAVFLGALAAGTTALVVPVLLVDPGAFVEHVLKFPVGLGRSGSPASSPFPGHLLAGTGPAGHALAMVLLLAAAAAIAAWLVVRPPRTAADAVGRTATGLGAAILLAPATRWGYLVYPVALIGAALLLRARSATAGSAEPDRTGAPVDPPPVPLG